MPTKQIKTKTKDREATEERLLLAAEHVFSKFGFKGATTRMIAKKADINLALITRYFDGKYGLLLKIVEKKTRQMHSDLPYAPKETVTEECMAYALLRMDTCLEDLNFFRIVIAQFLTDPKFLKRFQETLLTLKNYTHFESRLNQLVKDKKMSSDVSIIELYESIENHVFGLVMSLLIKGRSDKDIKDKLRTFIELYCKGIEL